MFFILNLYQFLDQFLGIEAAISVNPFSKLRPGRKHTSTSSAQEKKPQLKKRCVPALVLVTSGERPKIKPEAPSNGGNAQQTTDVVVETHP